MTFESKCTLIYSVSTDVCDAGCDIVVMLVSVVSTGFGRLIHKSTV